MKPHLRLGVLGLSPGNGHPYSWSAIFNGYDSLAMEKCEFPVIPRYLEKQNFPKDCIAEARVTHVWTQCPEISRRIAKASLIENIVDKPEDLIAKVDGILLARDDAEMHLEMARPFLEAGMPIYVDKPLAYSVDLARQLFSLQRYPGQIFSCSAMRYASELRIESISRVGVIRAIRANISKDWDKYSVHAIEPTLQLIPERGSIHRSSVCRVADQTSLVIKYDSGIELEINTHGKTEVPFVLHVVGSDGCIDLVFSNTFQAFRNALQDFVFGVLSRDVRTPPQQILDVIELIELGRQF